MGERRRRTPGNEAGEREKSPGEPEAGTTPQDSGQRPESEKKTPESEAGYTLQGSGRARPESGKAPGKDNRGGTTSQDSGQRPESEKISPWLASSVILFLLLLAAALSLSGGFVQLAAGDIARILWNGAAGLPQTDEGLATVVWQVRLPRILTALAAGAALGLSGAVFQGILLNPLADPYTLGVSSGAAFGAALVIVLSVLLPGAPILATPWALTAGAFAAACVTLMLVLALARGRTGGLSAGSLILAGVILSAILSAALSFVKYLAGEHVASIVFWLLGSFQARTWADAGVVAVFFLPAVVVALHGAVDLNVMTLGERSARTLGVDTARARRRLLAAASLAAAAAVAVAGVIGFVGLVVPHAMRFLTGPDHRSLLPLSALAGALLLTVADAVVRVLLPGEIPVGVLTALLAGPAFLVIFRRRAAGHGLD